jgi:hypothetical protein
MGTMNEQLLELRGRYATDPAKAEEEAKSLQFKISEWRGKIAAIDTLTRGPESDAESEVDDECRLPDDGTFTPTHAYWRPILQTLVESGGRGKCGRVIAAVGEKMKGILTPADYGRLPKSGWTRWENRVAWQASNMRTQGLIRNNSPRGIWEIADDGRKWLDDKNSERLAQPV